MKERIVFLDWLRVSACLTVMIVHSIEPFYLDDSGTFILNRTNALWTTILGSALRACVPLFVIASAYLLFPLKNSTGEFFQRRFTRVLVPFAVWSLVYVSAWGTKSDLQHLTFNFMSASGHLWFVYMLLGVYLIMPLLSAWAEKVSEKEERFFLIAWGFTTLVPFFRKASVYLFGSGELWGEANWNEFGALYTISGFIGYLLLGHYFKRHVGELSWKKTLAAAIPVWIAGYAISALWFWNRIPVEYPVDAPIDLAVDMEQGWRFCSFGTALQVIAYFLVIRKIKWEGKFYEKIILPLSKASYGTYLCHMLILVPFYRLYAGTFAGFAPAIGTPVIISLTAASTFIAASMVSIIIGKIPKIGHWITG